MWYKEVILKLEVTNLVCTYGGELVGVMYLSDSVETPYNHTVHLRLNNNKCSPFQ